MLSIALQYVDIMVLALPKKIVVVLMCLFTVKEDVVAT